jgi:hypothetical protein
MRPSRLVILVRMVREIATHPPTAIGWIWGAYLQFAWPVTLFSPYRRKLARQYRLRRKLRQLKTPALQGR